MTGFEMTLMSHLLVAIVLDERGQAYCDCTAPVSFEKVTAFSKNVLFDELRLGQAWFVLLV